METDALEAMLEYIAIQMATVVEILIRKKIVTNDEFEEIKKTVEQCIKKLRPDGTGEENVN